jgi:hypothetical protein
MGTSFVSLESPPTGIVEITPLDTVDLTRTIRGFMVRVAGDVEVVMADGTTGVYPACSVGAIYPGVITRVKNAMTTATGIVGFF